MPIEARIKPASTERRPAVGRALLLSLSLLLAVISACSTGETSPASGCAAEDETVEECPEPSPAR